MQKEGLKRFLIVLGILFVGFITVGSVSAQNTSNTNSTTVTTTTCPAATPIRCSDNSCAVAAANCPTTSSTTTTTTTCPAGTPIWCSTKNMCVTAAADCTVCSTDKPIWCSTKNICVTTAAECTSTSTTSCSSSSQRWCESKKMCVDNWTACDGTCGGGNYYCAYSDNSGGWCSSSPCTQRECEAVGKKWCRNSVTTCSMASSGWCTYSATDTCPPYDSASCTAAKGEWCGTWCAQNGATCPEMTWPYTQAECELYKGTWCPESGGTMSCTMMRCAMAGQSCSKMPGMMTCWDGTSASGSCPAMPSTKETCTTPANVGKVYWCENSGSGWSTGWCSTSPCTKEACQAVSGKYWCDYSTAGSASTATSGWCSDMKCAPSGKMICPDGDTAVTRLKDCPKKGIEEKTCPDGTKIPLTSSCPEQKKTCPDGSTVAADAVCPTLFVCPSGTKVATSADCPATDYKECIGGKKVLKGTDCPNRKLKDVCSDGVTEKIDGKECPLSEKQMQELKDLRDSYVKILDELYTFFNARGDTTLRDKSTALKLAIQSIPVTSAGKEVLEAKKVDLDLLSGERENMTIEDDKIRDEKNRIKKLQEAKNAIKGLPRAEIQKVLNNIKRIEDQEVTIPKLGKIHIMISTSLKDIVDALKIAMDTILSAQTYDEAENAIKDLLVKSTETESYDKYIGLINSPSQFVRTVNDIQKVITLESDELALLKKNLKSDEKKELEDTIGEAERLLTEAHDDFERFYKGEITGDVDEFVEESISEKLEEVSDVLEGIRQIKTFKTIVGDTKEKIGKYTKALNKRDRKTRELRVQGEIRDTATMVMKELSCFFMATKQAEENKVCSDIKNALNLTVIDLNQLTRQNKNQFEEKILPVITEVLSRTAKIDELLNLKKTSQLSKTLGSMGTSLEKIRSFDMQSTRETLNKIDTGANFYRADPGKEVSRVINGKNVSYSKFAAKW